MVTALYLGGLRQCRTPSSHMTDNRVLLRKPVTDRQNKANKLDAIVSEHD